MIRERSDLHFCKRIDRLEKPNLPPDWEAGYPHVTVLPPTVENQERADYRLPIYRTTDQTQNNHLRTAARTDRPFAVARPVVRTTGRRRRIGPRSAYRSFEWVLDPRRQCVERGVSSLPVSGKPQARLLKDGTLYRIRRQFQLSQAANRASTTNNPPFVRKHIA